MLVLLQVKQLFELVQVIALVAHMVQERRTPGPFMIVCPSSLIANWEQEFRHWAPALKLVSYKGSADARAALFAQQVRCLPGYCGLMLATCYLSSIMPELAC